jgi:shikimate dehydrogenase
LGETTFFVFGAGGAARAVCFTLAQEGAKKIFIVDKIDEASTSLAGDINSKAGAGKCAVDVPFGDYPFVPYLEQSDVLINASGVGMYPYTGETPLEKKYLRKELLVCDLTYNPFKTRLLVEAEELGCKIMNGIGMVVNQAVKGFNLLTGKGEPYEIMKEVMDKILSNAKSG